LEAEFVKVTDRRRGLTQKDRLRAGNSERGLSAELSPNRRRERAFKEGPLKLFFPFLHGMKPSRLVEFTELLCPPVWCQHRVSAAA
jgi:hypothetical protein